MTPGHNRNSKYTELCVRTTEGIQSHAVQGWLLGSLKALDFGRKNVRACLGSTLVSQAHKAHSLE